jgi:hypothetical protein
LPCLHATPRLRPWPPLSCALPRLLYRWSGIRGSHQQHLMRASLPCSSQVYFIYKVEIVMDCIYGVCSSLLKWHPRTFTTHIYTYWWRLSLVAASWYLRVYTVYRISAHHYLRFVSYTVYIIARVFRWSFVGFTACAAPTRHSGGTCPPAP